MKKGTNRTTGKLITGVEYLRQRIADVINTPLGSLVGRRLFGSRMHELLDRNVNAAFYMNAYVLLAEAINNKVNELDDLLLKEMLIESIGAAHYEITIIGEYNGEQIKLGGLKYG